MFIWTDDRIRWGKICNETNNLDKVKTDIIKPYIKDMNVADIGCGLGYLSLHISQYANTVISVDIAQNALDVLYDNISSKNIKNIIPIKSDIFNTNIYNIDYIIACFFCKPTQDLTYLLSMARKGVIIMLTTDLSSHELLDNKPHNYRQDSIILSKYLEEQGITYQKHDIVEENGQYLQNYEDAENFLSTFTKATKDTISTIIQESKLSKNIVFGDTSFEYFVSIQKEISIFIIDK